MAQAARKHLPSFFWGVKMERSLTFRHHLMALRKKLSSRVTLLRLLVGSGWGAGAKTLRIAALSLVHSTAEYSAPVLVSALLNGKITNGTRSIVKMLPGFVLLCPGPVPGLLG